ncbi:hypothetical protein DL546_007485 [Coniochaeta pulveracea]|nr:hypothetical protein DL546_007485 [Coniochaeta pulveracea]
MVANQSKHTVQFSDLAWEEDAPQLPRAWQIGRYLERYRDRYCKDADIRLGSNVAAAEPVSVVDHMGQASTNWRLIVETPEGGRERLQFDYLLIAAGFFSRPALPGVHFEQAGIPVIHSSAYRNLSSLGLPAADKGKNILVVGGQMSGVEIAGTIATHLSSATNATGPSCIPELVSYSVQHVIQRPVWVFPLHTSPNPTSPVPSFLPLDLPSYNLSNRPSPLINTQGHISEEAAKRVHSLFQTALGTDQSNFSPTVAVPEHAGSDPAYLAVSDTYMDFVRCGLIKVARGRLASISHGTATITPDTSELPERHGTAEATDSAAISQLAAVILATGFDATAPLSFLPREVLETLSYSPTDQVHPVALAFHGTHHPSVPNLGFVGFYRSPYWGVMEMQARFLADLWSASPASPSMAEALAKDTSIERSLELRTDPRASQFPMGDYAYLMQEFAAALNMKLRPAMGETPPLPPAGKGMDILTPARYPDNNLTEEQDKEVTEALQQTYRTTLNGLTGTSFVAKVVFRSLLGEWKLERDIVSQLPSHPSGHFSGTAKFLLRAGTMDGREGSASAGQDDVGLAMEYLYIEQGDFKANNGFTFRATRRYVYRYDEKKDKLSVWFVKTDDQKKADYLFHEVDFARPDDDKKPWTATAGHLCIDDFYDVKYEFGFQAVNLKNWRIRYSVKGPKKDYTIDGTYTR